MDFVVRSRHLGKYILFFKFCLLIFRKPPILPPAKKTLYTVDHPKWENPEHIHELLWRRHVYNNAMISLRKVFAEEIKQKEREGLAIEGLRKQELEELDLLIAENERRNREIARERFEF